MTPPKKINPYNNSHNTANKHSSSRYQQQSTSGAQQLGNKQSQQSSNQENRHYRNQQNLQNSYSRNQQASNQKNQQNPHSENQQNPQNSSSLNQQSSNQQNPQNSYWRNQQASNQQNSQNSYSRNQQASNQQNSHSENQQSSNQQNTQNSCSRNQQSSNQKNPQNSYSRNQQSSNQQNSQNSYSRNQQASNQQNPQNSYSRNQQNQQDSYSRNEKPSGSKVQQSSENRNQQSETVVDSRYTNVIMKSSWYDKMPENFCKDYIAVMCPTGTRTLVVAEKGQTTFYNKKGRQTKCFKSALPGGNLMELQSNCFKTILDCIWDEEKETIYVLDVIFWRGQSYENNETTLRFFWIQSIFNDIPALQIVHENNRFKFDNVKRGHCDPYQLNILLHNARYEIEGMLFYHKNLKYTAGESQLVKWALRWMSFGLFGLPGPQGPLNTTPEQYIQTWNKNRQKKTHNESGSAPDEKSSGCE